MITETYTPIQTPKPSISIYMWSHNHGWPYYISTKTAMPHKHNRKTPLEYFQQQFIQEANRKCVITFEPPFTKATDEFISKYLESLRHDMFTLGFPIFDLTGQLAEYVNSSKLATLRKCLPELFEYDVIPYLDEIVHYLGETYIQYKPHIPRKLSKRK